VIIFDPAAHPPAKSQGMLSSLIVPRPIAMISTLGADGVVNVAPFSYVMPVTGSPPLVAVTIGGRRDSSSGPKDTWRNAQRTGEFVINTTTDAMRHKIEAAAMELPDDASELELLGWHAVPSQKVGHPSIAESPAHLECRIHTVVDFGDDDVAYSTVHLVVAEVVCIVVDDSVCSPDLQVDPHALAPVGRMTFPWFVRAGGDALFPLARVPYAEYARTGSHPALEDPPS
jgi:flavin reductase (DIM6/NTAB) family NADH-FMN oxidoreductase RutF